MPSQSKILRNVPFHRQEQDNWCIPACAQMILGVHGQRKLEQATIADTMQTSPAGTLLSDEIAGYRTILGNNFVVTNAAVNWDRAKEEIDAGYPFRIRINEDTHAVVCIGYEINQQSDNTGYYDLILILNDPHEGESIHFNWDSISQYDYLFIHKS